MMIFGYARVSTNEQDHALQINALNAAGVDELITDQISGSTKNRPGLDRLLDKAREGDTIVIWRLDRLGRSLANLIDLVEALKTRGIHLKSLQEEINTSSANGQLMFHIFGALAEFERSLIKERVKAGLEAAKAEGRVGGRPKALTDEQRNMARSLVDAGHSKAEVSKTLNISKATLYRALKEA